MKPPPEEIQSGKDNMISSEEKFYYEFEKGGIRSYIPHSKEDFYDLVGLWSSADLYKDFESETIHLRLIPAFEQKQILAFQSGINNIGFITWCWMSDNEYEGMNYTSPDLFSRSKGDKFVLADCIIVGGSKIVKICTSHMKNFFWNYYPEVPKGYFHRPHHNGNVYNKGYK